MTQNRLDPELALLALLAMNPNAMAKNTLQAHEFHNELHKNLFTEMQKQYVECGSVDFILLGVRLTGLVGQLLQEVTNIAFLDFRDGNQKSYEQALRERNRNLIVERVIEKYGTDNPELIITKIREALAYEAADTKSLDEIYSQVFNELEQVSNGERPSGLTVGLPWIDRTLNGIKKKNLIVLGARPSTGKSALVLNFVLNILKQGKRVVWYALEESKEDIFKRMVANLTGIPLQYMYGTLKPEHWSMYLDCRKQIESFDLVLDDTPRASVEEMSVKCLNHARHRPVDLIVIDHMQLVKSEGRHPTRDRELAEISGLLKALAKNLDCPVLVLSQLNRAIEARKDSQPQLSDLRDSGAIEQDADVVILLDRDKENAESILGVHIRKQRNGATGSRAYMFIPETMTVQEIDSIDGFIKNQ